MLSLYPQGVGERRIGLPVGGEAAAALHLYEKQHIGLVSRVDGLGQLQKMLPPPLRRRVGEHGRAAALQGHALDLREDPPLPLLQIKVKAGVDITFLRIERTAGEQLPQQLPGRGVGGLGVHVDEHVPLVDGHQVVSRFPGGAVSGDQDHPGSGDEQLPAAAGVLHMHRLRHAVEGHPGDKPVGPLEKNGGD